MASGIEPLPRLISVLAKLPGVGRRSAERMAYKLARDHGSLKRDLVHAISEVEANICVCSRCGNLTLRTEDPCRLCTDPRRDDTLICVVEDPGDILIIEKAGAFRGRYHALMGKISPMHGEGVQHMRVRSLLERVRDRGVREVVLALNSDVEGDATASYLHEVLGPLSAKVTRLALGIPAGSGIAYSDAVTLTRAIQGRQPI